MPYYQVYCAFTNPSSVPQIDVSQLSTPPVENDKERNIGLHVSALKTEPMTPNYAKTAENAAKTLANLSITQHGAPAFNITNATLFENDPRAAEVEQGMYVYILSSPKATEIMNSIAGYMQKKFSGPRGDRKVVRSIGDGNGSFHISMYYKPTNANDNALLPNLMKEAAAQSPTIEFNNFYTNPNLIKGSMTKISFSKVSAAEYREHLSKLSEKDLADIIFISGANDENVDEFGNKTSASMLAADEIMIRNSILIDPSTVVDQEGVDADGVRQYSAHLQRIAAKRGIFSDSAEDLFR
jgi:hypothetical protein